MSKVPSLYLNYCAWYGPSTPFTGQSTLYTYVVPAKLKTLNIIAVGGGGGGTGLRPCGRGGGGGAGGNTYSTTWQVAPGEELRIVVSGGGAAGSGGSSAGGGGGSAVSKKDSLCTVSVQGGAGALSCGRGGSNNNFTGGSAYGNGNSYQNTAGGGGAGRTNGGNAYSSVACRGAGGSGGAGAVILPRGPNFALIYTALIGAGGGGGGSISGGCGNFCHSVYGSPGRGGYWNNGVPQNGLNGWTGGNDTAGIGGGGGASGNICCNCGPVYNQGGAGGQGGRSAVFVWGYSPPACCITFAQIACTFHTPGYSPGTNGVKIFNTVGNSNFVVPSGVTTLKVALVGGGGGGGGGSQATCGSPGGGGGGGQLTVFCYAVTPGETLTLTVGAGGLGGKGTGARPQAGGNTTIKKSTCAGTLTAYGGQQGFCTQGYCFSGGGSYYNDQTHTYVGGGRGYQGPSYTGYRAAGGGGAGAACPGLSGHNGYNGTLGGCGLSGSGGSGGSGGTLSIGGYSYNVGGGGGGGGGGTAGAGYYFAGGGNGGNGVGHDGVTAKGYGGGGGGGGPGCWNCVPCAGPSPILAGKGGDGYQGAVFLYAPGTSGPSTSVVFSNYYRNGGLVPCVPQNANIPTSGQLQICEFYGSQNTFAYTYYLPACNYAYNLCLPAAAAQAGANISCSQVPVYANITICGVLGSNAEGKAALIIGPNGSWGTPPIVRITVGSKGVITGRGATYLGDFVHGATPAICFICGPNTIVTNNGVIQGGAGGSCQNYGFAAGAGYAYGLGALGNTGHGSYNSTLFSGGAYQVVDTRGKKGGGYYTTGCGGGWVAAACQSQRTDGYGGNGTGPARAFISAGGGSTSNLNFVVKGTIHGSCGL